MRAAREQTAPEAGDRGRGRQKPPSLAVAAAIASRLLPPGLSPPPPKKTLAENWRGPFEGEGAQGAGRKRGASRAPLRFPIWPAGAAAGRVPRPEQARALFGPHTPPPAPGWAARPPAQSPGAEGGEASRGLVGALRSCRLPKGRTSGKAGGEAAACRARTVQTRSRWWEEPGEKENTGKGEPGGQVGMPPGVTTGGAPEEAPAWKGGCRLFLHVDSDFVWTASRSAHDWVGWVVLRSWSSSAMSGEQNRRWEVGKHRCEFRRRKFDGTFHKSISDRDWPSNFFKKIKTGVFFSPQRGYNLLSLREQK